MGSWSCSPRGARRAGPQLTDVLEGPLLLARRIGAEAAINVAANADALEADARSVDGYEVTFEVSGNPAGLATCLEWVRPGAIVVQVVTGCRARFRLQAMPSWRRRPSCAGDAF